MDGVASLSHMFAGAYGNRWSLRQATCILTSQKATKVGFHILTNLWVILARLWIVGYKGKKEDLTGLLEKTANHRKMLIIIGSRFGIKTEEMFQKKCKTHNIYLPGSKDKKMQCESEEA